jgi:hypothetical protein
MVSRSQNETWSTHPLIAIKKTAMNGAQLFKTQGNSSMLMIGPPVKDGPDRLERNSNLRRLIDRFEEESCVVWFSFFPVQPLVFPA